MSLILACWTVVNMIVHEKLGGIIERIYLTAQLFIDGHQIEGACTVKSIIQK